MRASLLPILALLIGCPAEPEPVVVVPPPDLIAGAPRAGAAEGTLELPVGTPLAGFTARCGCFSGYSRQDDRDSAYTVGFVESTGVQIRPQIKALWLENGDQHTVITKVDLIYSFDGLVDALTDRLEAETGEDLRGKVVIATNHNHSSYGTYSDAVAFYLGSDRFNRENFERMVDQLAEVALEAYGSRDDAAIGVGWAKDWDPENKVYSDRRGANNELVVWEDDPEYAKNKDPYLQVLRVDHATGEPMAIMMGWGMHPYVAGEDSPMATADATALAEMEVAEQFDEPVVVMHIQTAGGDASVRGSDDGYPRMETVGVYARDAVLDLWSRTPTSSDPLTLETHSLTIPTNLDAVRVDRGGAVDWHYLPVQDEDWHADDIVYDANGNLISPLDEFNTEFGAAFCGSGDFDVPVGGIASDAPEYTSCMKIDLMSRLVLAFFRLEEWEVELPLLGTTQTNTTAAKLGPVPVLFEDGTEESGDFLMGFFPGEPLSMFTEQWRRRSVAELGIRNSIAFGYAQDHQGYLTIPEDWLSGGYEPDISFWGPLVGEYILEQTLYAARDILSTDVREPLADTYGPENYPERAFPTAQPDLSPDWGRITELPDYFWVPDGFTARLETPEIVPRITGQVQLGWIGGDPGVDNPHVFLERQEEGEWVKVTSHAGRPITEDWHDILIAHTPDPLFPAEAVQTHYWWTVWQAVGHIRDRVGLPTGSYRLRVEGQRYLGGDEHWPWTTEPYEVTTDSFEVVPAVITLTAGDGGFSASLRATEENYRLIDVAGRSRSDNPLRGDLTLRWEGDAFEPVEVVVAAGEPVDSTTWLPTEAPDGATRLVVTDPYGNLGTLEL